MRLKAQDIAKKAAELVAGERDRTHGDKLKNFENIATLWNAYLSMKRLPINAADVGQMMALMKIARTASGDFNIDDYIDGAGYIACSGEIASNADEKAKSWSRVA
jgi:hypothetical protein